MNFETNNRTEPYPAGTRVVVTWCDDPKYIGDIMDALDPLAERLRAGPREGLLHQMFLDLEDGDKGMFPINWTSPLENPDKAKEESRDVVLEMSAIPAPDNITLLWPNGDKMDWLK